MVLLALAAPSYMVQAVVIGRRTSNNLMTHLFHQRRGCTRDGDTVVRRVVRRCVTDCCNTADALRSVSNLTSDLSDVLDDVRAVLHHDRDRALLRDRTANLSDALLDLRDSTIILADATRPVVRDGDVPDALVLRAADALRDRTAALAYALLAAADRTIDLPDTLGDPGRRVSADVGDALLAVRDRSADVAGALLAIRGSAVTRTDNVADAVLGGVADALHAVRDGSGDLAHALSGDLAHPFAG